MLDARYWMRDTGYGLRVTRCGIQDAGPPQGVISYQLLGNRDKIFFKSQPFQQKEYLEIRIGFSLITDDD
jgi:hypothetical protein